MPLLRSLPCEGRVVENDVIGGDQCKVSGFVVGAVGMRFVRNNSHVTESVESAHRRAATRRQHDDLLVLVLLERRDRRAIEAWRRRERSDRRGKDDDVRE